MALRTIIVEDEAASRERLRRLLEAHAGTLQVIAEADNGPEAVRLIAAEEPDLVFLDVSLPGFDGFEVLKAGNHGAAVIFTTAFDKYAVQAIRASAVDYLLKPIEPQELAAAVARVSQAQQRGPAPPLDQMLSVLRSSRQIGPRRLACRVGDSTFFVTLDEVLLFRAEQGYTTVRTSSREYLIDTPLVELENRLDPEDFVRIHRNSIVNMQHVASLKRLTDGRIKVILDEGSEIESSRRYSDNLRRWS